MDRDKALDLALGQIEKQFGKGAVMRLGDDSVRMSVKTISTGSLSLDIALGSGGVPLGRITEIFGAEGSGKTTLALHIIAECQKGGGTAAFIDAEHALDPTYCTNLGVDIDNLYISQPDHGEQALEIADTLVRSGAIQVIVVDSVAALVPRAELEGEMGDTHMGLQARLMSQALRKLSGSLNRSHCAAVFVNQIREKIGVVFGNPETTPGGRALKFWSSVRLQVTRAEAIKSGTDSIGQRCRVRVLKNKLAPPFKQAEFDMIYGKGISREGDLLDQGLEGGILSRTGTWYAYGDTRLGQGRENAKDFLVQNAEVASELEATIRAKHGLTTGTDITGEGESPAEVEEQE
ncbi:MAG: recombinase RecA [Armatimonadetes bacterium CG_4_10_14_3_um_filter_66_18]|nr:recombinase RecA [Armatimonadota bacterium]OIP04518.1 MAG: recombinase RecA [Armatimonadetes bacterium CG2_30_66_41]PIU94708.1 MAG: recombinase RecA [Armatimonadetes bacterium CG06_land_8_20_14_3_00_66_21]PIX49630.1 MAG: recombinase RecA [Armatimonadetes bacterium CG_4_8_14_3_um_filter_66_20]PIY48024.1 MAG: recombinase RecA [Armatimonadetes bacterium CG_4_10_14_3_um_filter_66_18]PIZ48934.1 MAG: recombinase RecA [Armatimonadetes bacterium CG_4_10_14_0_8_um_filter_66_14]PJB60257.1 MAG: recom